jgi:hypothetical protein
LDVLIHVEQDVEVSALHDTLRAFISSFRDQGAYLGRELFVGHGSLGNGTHQTYVSAQRRVKGGCYLPSRRTHRSSPAWNNRFKSTACSYRSCVFGVPASVLVEAA